MTNGKKNDQVKQYQWNIQEKCIELKSYKNIILHYNKNTRYRTTHQRYLRSLVDFSSGPYLSDTCTIPYRTLSLPWCVCATSCGLSATRRSGGFSWSRGCGWSIWSAYPPVAKLPIKHRFKKKTVKWHEKNKQNTSNERFGE